MKLVANKDVFINKRGEKKTRVFKNGNIYEVINVLSTGSRLNSNGAKHPYGTGYPWKSYKVSGDNGGSYWYTEYEISQLFSSLETGRGNKLQELGI